MNRGNIKDLLLDIYGILTDGNERKQYNFSILGYKFSFNL